MSRTGAPASQLPIDRWARSALILWPVMMALAAWVFWRGSDEMWSAATWWDPIGTDEFGRDLLATAIAAAGLSFAKGCLLTMLVIVVGIVVAEAMTLARSSVVSSAVSIVARVLESVPTVFWVVAVVVVLKESRTLVAAVAFVLIVVPSASTVVAGELQRLRLRPFVESAYLLGVAEWRVLVRHIIPHSRSVLVPFAIQVLGGAIAIDGAIGVLGLGSRSDLDLGVFLIRGRESFSQHPQVMWVGLAMYLAIYGYLFALVQAGRRSNPAVEAT